MAKNMTLIVCGMHRSGTSAMAGLLGSLGCNLGAQEDLQPANKFNEKGYFERRDVVALNDSILSHLVNKSMLSSQISDYFHDPIDLAGSGWIFGAWIPSSDKQSLPESLKISIANLTNSWRKEQNFPLIIKDPRISLTSQYWTSHFDAPAFIIMVRNPKDVARSLYMRDKLNPRDSFELWARYTAAAINAAHNHPHILIDYDTLLDNPQNTIRSILEHLPLAGRLRSESADEIAASFLSQSLRHESTDSFFEPPAVVSEAYDLLLDFENHSTEKIQQSLNKIMTEDGWKRVLYVLELHTYRSQFTALQYRISDLESRIERLNKHPIVGPILKLARRLKNDPGFGGLE